MPCPAGLWSMTRMVGWGIYDNRIIECRFAKAVNESNGMTAILIGMLFMLPTTRTDFEFVYVYTKGLIYYAFGHFDIK
jgi:hypothetical protein